MAAEVFQISKKDINSVIGCLRLFHEEFSDIEAFKFEQDEARVHTFLGAIVGDSKWFVGAVKSDGSGSDNAAISGILIGHCDESVFAPIKYAEEKLLWVRPSFRHKNFGGALVIAFESWAANEGCHKVVMSAQASKYLTRMTSWFYSMGYSEQEVVFSKTI